VGTIAVRSFKVFGNLAQRAGPYLLLEILLPGGTLFALLFFLYRRSRQLGANDAPRTGVRIARTIGKLLKEMVCAGASSDIASLWRGSHRQRDGLEALAMSPLI